jgi:hypothetical protein
MKSIVIPPVPHLPIPILELICNELAADVSRLGRHLAALRSEAAPPSKLSEIIRAAHTSPTPKCKHADIRTFTFSDRSTITRCPDCGKTKGHDVLSGDGKIAPPKVKKSAATFLPPRVKAGRPNYCSPVEPFVAVELRVWSEQEERARLHVKPMGPRFGQVTPEDVVWASRQSAFPHSQPMPRCFKNFCPHCAEVVTNSDSVLRETKGLYLPIEHECPKVHVVEGVPTIAHKSVVVVRPTKFRSAEAAQNHFETKLVTFVGDGAELEVIDSFKYNPRVNHSDQREKDLMGWAQRRSHVGVVVGPTCLRCTTPITKRKGSKYCSENCKKRQWEETNTKGAKLTCQHLEQSL